MSAAIIYADNRTGGTFLAHCLSNHPDIHCPREEAIHSRSYLYNRLEHDKLSLLRYLLNQYHYQVSMMKIVYGHIDAPEWDYLREQRTKVIHLIRSNTVRQAISLLIYESKFVPGARLDPGELLRLCRFYAPRVNEMRAFLEETGLPVLEVDYIGITGRAVEASEVAPYERNRICDFLEVTRLSLPGTLGRVNPQPLKLIVENWDECAAVLQGSEFAYCLKTEAYG